jgi:hypothetical protein
MGVDDSLIPALMLPALSTGVTVLSSRFNLHVKERTRRDVFSIAFSLHNSRVGSNLLHSCNRIAAEQDDGRERPKQTRFSAS